MLDSIAIFATLLILWMGLRYWGARWLWFRAHQDRISFRSAQLIHAGFYFLLPFIGLPWVRTATDVAFLFAAGVVLFVFQLVLARGYRRFLDRNA